MAYVAHIPLEKGLPSCRHISITERNEPAYATSICN